MQSLEARPNDYPLAYPLASLILLRAELLQDALEL